MSTSGGDEWDEAYTATNQQEPQPLYNSLENWVTGWLAPMIRRPSTNATAWCAEWWRHGEAVSRLEALWRAWEALRLDGTTGMSQWWLQHADQHLALLTDKERSPFAECVRGHVELDSLTTHPAPTGWWGENTPSTETPRKVVMEPNTDSTYTATCPGCGESAIVDGNHELDEFEAGHIGCDAEDAL